MSDPCKCTDCMLTVKERCRKYHIQDCHVCDDFDCCDNLNYRGQVRFVTKTMERVGAILRFLNERVNCIYPRFDGGVELQYRRARSDDTDLMDYLVVRADNITAAIEKAMQEDSDES